MFEMYATASACNKLDYKVTTERGLGNESETKRSRGNIIRRVGGY